MSRLRCRAAALDQRCPARDIGLDETREVFGARCDGFGGILLEALADGLMYVRNDDTLVAVDLR